MMTLKDIPNLKISPHFTLKELISSKSEANVIANYEWYRNSKDVQNNLALLANEVLEPIREYIMQHGLQKGLQLSCALRSGTHNASLANASKTSHHPMGLAADTVYKSITVKNEVYRALFEKRVKINYDILAQVIYESNPSGGHWIHIGRKPVDGSWKRGLEYLYCKNDGKKILCPVKKTQTTYPWVTNDNIDKILK